MTLTESQLAQLAVVFPFFRDGNWQEMAADFEETTGATTDEHFAGMLDAATQAGGWLQYLLETPDELLQGGPVFRRGTSARPGNATPFELEVAGATAKLVGGVTLANFGASAELTFLYHVPPGTAATVSDLNKYAIWGWSQGPTSSGQYALGITLLPGEKLICATGANTSISTYVAG